MSALKTVTRADLAALSAAAAAAARRRKNSNLHPALDDPVQRLLNAFEPGTYVRPHRHQTSPKWELMARLAGHAVLLTFDDDGVVRDRIDIDADTPVIEIPVGTWHTLVAIETGTVLLEVKPGPYTAAAPADFADWSPPEGGDAAAALEAWCRTARAGQRAPR
jgi:cupin fold WbuC family metalloprotein